MSLKVYENEVTEWVVAESHEEATELLKAHYNMTEEEFLEAHENGKVHWISCNLERNFTYQSDDGPITKSFAEWIELKGKGFLATSEY